MRRSPHGDDSAASRKEALLAALAGCTAIDVCSILEEAGVGFGL